MSRLIKKHWSYFQLLINTTSKQQRKQLLDTITHDQLRALTEVIVNLLQSILPIKPYHKLKLKRNRNIIRRIGDTKISSKKRKELLCRQGTVISYLLKSVEPALRDYIQ